MTKFPTTVPCAICGNPISVRSESDSDIYLRKNGEVVCPKCRAAELRSQIAVHNHRYYVLSEPLIPDPEYDSLVKELKELERAHPELRDPNSPTARVGSDLSVSTFAKVKHDPPMLSLDNCFDEKEVWKFFDSAYAGLGIAKSMLVAEPKYDGASLQVSYDNGEFVQAATRGNGEEGDDVTLNARTITNLPLKIPFKGKLKVRGECVMKQSTFAKLNAELEKAGDELMANPRNAASGAIKLKDSRECAKRKLSFVAYQSIGGPPENTTYRGILKALDDQGFATPLGIIYTCRRDCIEHISEVICRYRKTLDEMDIDYDGICFKVDSLEEREALGLATKSPRWAVAFKYPPPEALTKLKQITVQIGRTGTLTPVAELEPVTLGGAVVRRASMMNLDEVQRIGADVGDEVVVIRSAYVIPRVLRTVATKKSSWKMPTKCPCCDTPVVKAQIQSGEGVAYKCPNKKCPEQVYQRLLHACSKAALDMDGCGDSFVQALVKCGCEYLSDVFCIGPNGWTTSLNEIKPYLSESVGKAALAKFFKSREKAKAAPLWRKLAALGAEGVGKTLCQEIATRWPSLDAILEASDEDLKAILGEVDFKSFMTCLAENAKDIERLQASGFEFKDERKTGVLSGKTFVITGALVSGTRDRVAERIENAGGVVKASVGKNVDFLVVGEGGGRTKAAAAEKRGTTLISEATLYKMIGIDKVPVVESGEEREF